MDPMDQAKLGTLAVHAGEEETLAVPSVTTPIYSIGLEDPDDLVADFRQALERA